jgi:hypothetical protein
VALDCFQIGSSRSKWSLGTSCPNQGKESVHGRSLFLSTKLRMPTFLKRLELGYPRRRKRRVSPKSRRKENGTSTYKSQNPRCIEWDSRREETGWGTFSNGFLGRAGLLFLFLARNGIPFLSTDTVSSLQASKFMPYK